LIEAFIAKKQEWIIKKQQEINQKKIFNSHNKNSVWYLGERHPLITLKEDFKEALIFTDRFFISESKLLLLKQILVKWYKAKAQELIFEKAEKYSLLLGVSYKSIKINSANQRWGSCTAQKNINFSYRIMMCPEFVIDYIVVHELSHLKQMNHSIKFWHVVAQHFPRYKEARKWLRDHGLYLH
jgi:hypothetical protein